MANQKTLTGVREKSFIKAQFSSPPSLSPPPSISPVQPRYTLIESLNAGAQMLSEANAFVTAKMSEDEKQPNSLDASQDKYYVTGPLSQDLHRQDAPFKYKDFVRMPQVGSLSCFFWDTPS